MAFIGDGRRDSLVGGQSDLSCALHIYLGLGPRSLGTIHDPLGDDEASSGSMVCGIDSTLPANCTAATAEVMPSVLDEMHFIGCRKAASLAGRAKLKPEPDPGPEPKPNVEPEHESELDMRLYKAPATLLLIQPLFLLQKSTRAHPAWQYTHTRATRG